MAGHTPWNEIRHKRPQRYWHDLRFVHTAESGAASQAAVDELVEAAKRLGLELELGNSTTTPPVDAPFR